MKEVDAYRTPAKVGAEAQVEEQKIEKSLPATFWFSLALVFVEAVLVYLLNAKDVATVVLLCFDAALACIVIGSRRIVAENDKKDFQERARRFALKAFVEMNDGSAGKVSESILDCAHGAISEDDSVRMANHVVLYTRR